MTEILPVIDDDSRPYWNALREHRLQMQRCGACSRFVFYPRAICPYCQHAALPWVAVSGMGTIHSFTVSRRPAAPSLADRTPYVVALIDLDEGVRMLSTIRTDDIDTIYIDQRVQVGFEDVTAEVTLPYFTVIPETR